MTSKKSSSKNIELKDYFINALILLAAFILVGTVYVFNFCNTLSEKELSEIKAVYTEMNTVDRSIKSEFYLNTVIKYLDRQVVLEELRHDAVRYSIIVSENAFEMLQNDFAMDTITGYLYRCNLDFEKFVGLDDAVNIYNLTEDYFINFEDDVDGLTEYSQELNDIVNPVEEEYTDIVRSRGAIVAFILVLYVVLLIWLNKKNISLYRRVTNGDSNK